MLRVRTGPECPEGNRRELMRDSNLNCGIAREREKFNRPNTAGRSQNKGTDQVQRRALQATDRSSPAGDWRQPGGERGRLGPKDCSPYRTANRPPVSNRRLSEILDGRHPPEGRCETQGSGTRPARAETETGIAEGRRRGTRGECSHQAPGCLSRSDGEGTKSRRSFLFQAFVEHPRARTAGSAGHAP